MSKGVADIVKDQLLAKIEAEGRLPWQKPWRDVEAMNYVTRKPYNGVNRLLLDSGEYLTFKQVQDLGGTVNKRAKGNVVVFTKTFEPKNDDIEISADGSHEKRILRYYKVFSLKDVTGIESKIEMSQALTPAQQKTELEAIIKSYKDIPEILHGGNRACYIPGTDQINMPEKTQFPHETGYYATLLHEMAHSTGHEKRLNREGIAQCDRRDKDKYSKEELIAEIAATGLMHKAGVEITKDNSAAYVAGWMKYLKNEKGSAIISAASAAQKAVDYIVGNELFNEIPQGKLDAPVMTAEVNLEVKTEERKRISVAVKDVEKNFNNAFSRCTSDKTRELIKEVLDEIAKFSDKSQKIKFPLWRDGKSIRVDGMVKVLKKERERINHKTRESEGSER